MFVGFFPHKHAQHAKFKPDYAFYFMNSLLVEVIMMKLIWELCCFFSVKVIGET